MAGHDWVFVNEDGSVDRQTIEAPAPPSTGDGKEFGGRGYKVEAVLAERIGGRNPIVVAIEVPIAPPELSPE
jgi:hypothetical protein